MKSNQNNSSQTPPNTPLLQRRLKTKPTLILLAILLVGNLFWFVLWLLPSKETAANGSDEQVAAVDGIVITRQQWLAEIESRYGKETLRSLVNEAVMEKAAEDYKIKVTDEEIDLEIALLSSAQDADDTTIQHYSTEQYRQSVRARLILEKVLTKDVVIEESATEAYYEENQSLYNIPTTYRTSIIVVDSKDEAEKVQKELKSGSDFSVLAREKSKDGASASLGGDIGFVSNQQENVDAAILKAIDKLDKQDISKPFALTDGRYAVAQVNDIIEEQSFDYKDVQEQISRQLAMDQLPASISPESFWSEFDVKWFYGDISAN